ncbi:MAG: class I SAM-dependent methyltransferase, partial [Acidimicrobiales bacterium]
GKAGLGFGVGREPLVAAFAGRGVDVLATDLAGDDPRSLRWASTDQHALRLEALSRPTCPEQLLQRHVQLRSVDMNAIPDDIGAFDFVWSSCALEHLGSLEAGMRFVERAMDCLVPGGIAVHTTEFNLDSDDDTVTAGPTVAFRRRDILDLLERLRRRGHAAEPFTVGERTGVLDYVIDVPPHHYSSLLVRLGRYRLTSAIIIVHAATDLTNRNEP